MSPVTAGGQAAVVRRSARPDARGGWSIGMACLVAYTMVAIGRIQEVVPALAQIRVGLVFGLLALIAWLAAPGSLREKIPLQVKPVKDVLLLLALAVVTIPVSVWPGNSYSFLTSSYIKTVVLFLLVLSLCRSVEDVRRMIWGAALALAMLVTAGVLSGNLHRPDAGPIVVEKYASQTYDPNDMAFVLVMIMPLLLYLFSTARWWLKPVVIGMILVSMYGIVLTQSRGGFLALVVVGLVTLWRSTLSRQQKLVIALGAALIFGVAAGNAFWDRIRTIWDPQTEYDRTAGGRTDVWKTGLVIMLTHPWGVGIDGFVTAEGLSHGGKGKWSAPHNTFLQIGADLGIAGLVIFILLLKHTFLELHGIQQAARPPTKRSLIRRVAGGRFAAAPEATRTASTREIVELASALEISLIGFAVGGFFLSQAYGPLPYLVVALSLVTARLAGRLPTAMDRGHSFRSGRLHRPHGWRPAPPSSTAALPGRIVLNRPDGRHGPVSGPR